MEREAIERLEAKSPEQAIIGQIAEDFNLAPFMAKTQFEQMRRYFERYLGLERDVGEITFLAVNAEAPPGRPMPECQQIPVNLTLDSPDDLEAMRQGVAALRRSKIQRLTREAQDQGALLTQEDLARLLCASRSTIKRDIACLRSQGVDVPTRGQMKDIGRGVSHKTWIVGDWLAGCTFSDIKKRRWHAPIEHGWHNRTGEVRPSQFSVASRMRWSGLCPSRASGGLTPGESRVGRIMTRRPPFRETEGV